MFFRNKKLVEFYDTLSSVLSHSKVHFLNSKADPPLIYIYLSIVLNWNQEIASKIQRKKQLCKKSELGNDGQSLLLVHSALFCSSKKKHLITLG